MGFAGSERPAPWRVGGAISSLPAFLASLGILVKLTSAACSPRLDGAVSKRSWAGEVRNVSLLVAIGSRPRAIARSSASAKGPIAGHGRSDWPARSAPFAAP
jgi:hypothetical protein